MGVNYDFESFGSHDIVKRGKPRKTTKKGKKQDQSKEDNIDQVYPTYYYHQFKYIPKGSPLIIPQMEVFAVFTKQRGKVQEKIQ